MTALSKGKVLNALVEGPLEASMDEALKRIDYYMQQAGV